MGGGLTEVKPTQGFAAESSTAATILASSHLGFALSTTQVASGSVIGSGLGRRGSEVRWRTVGRIFVGWLLTLPAAGLVGALAALLVVWSRNAGLGVTGVIIDAVVAVFAIVFMFLRSARNQVHAGNAMSEVAASGHAVNIDDNPPPTPRQQRKLEEQERRKAAAKAAAAKKADAKKAAKKGNVK